MKNALSNLLLITGIAGTALAASCGTAQSITSAAACSTLITSIGEARHLAPERAVADIRAVGAVCRRLQQDAPDAGVDGGTHAEQ